MQSGVGKYTEGYAPSKRKALDGPHTSIGLILISIEGSDKKSSRDGLLFYSLFFGKAGVKSFVRRCSKVPPHLNFIKLSLNECHVKYSMLIEKNDLQLSIKNSINLM